MKKLTIQNIAVGAAILVGVFYIYKSFSKKDTKVGDKATGSGSGTFSESELQKMANDLQDAFDGYGTKNSVVISILESLKSQSDFDALSNVYGVRKISSGRFNVFVSDFTGNLTECIKNEMGSGYIASINDSFKANGIKPI